MKSLKFLLNIETNFFFKERSYLYNIISSTHTLLSLSLSLTLLSRPLSHTSTHLLHATRIEQTKTSQQHWWPVL